MTITAIFDAVGVVINIIIADPSGVPGGVALPDGAGIGWMRGADGEPWTAPAELPTRVPTQVTMRQARLALLGAGMLGAVQSAIDALPSPQKEAAQIEWDYSQEVQRHNGFVSVLAPMIGLTGEQTDALFIAADAL